MFRHTQLQGRECDTRWVVMATRASRSEDGPTLQEIERLADERFGDVGLAHVADDEPFAIETLSEYAASGRGWVAVDDLDQPVGYVLVDDVDGNAHVEQVSVRPEYQGLGVGRSLIERVRAWAVHTRKPAVTLTTFKDVAWNQPLYEHLGFRVLREDEIGPGLTAVRDAEVAHGLDPTTRVCMRLDLES